MPLLKVSIIPLLVTLALMHHVVTISMDECKCHGNMQNYYKELNCKPVNANGACCPTNFDCGSSLTNRSKETCHLKGEEFPLKSIITRQQLTGNPCVPECQCTVVGTVQEANFHCTHTDCPEIYHEILEENCVRLYAADKCCSVGTYCSNGTDEFTCKYGGRTYVPGQQFYQKEAPCKKCFCQAGYNGTMNGPWCTDISCGIEIHNGGKIRDGCAPIFYGENGCCPIGWRCPTGSDKVVPAKTEASAADTKGKCTFGSLELNMSDTLSMLDKDKGCVTCTCSIPPHVTCIRKGYSGLQSEGLNEHC